MAGQRWCPWDIHGIALVHEVTPGGFDSLVSVMVDCGPPLLEKKTGALMETAFCIAFARIPLMSPWDSFCRSVPCGREAPSHSKATVIHTV